MPSLQKRRGNNSPDHGGPAVRTLRRRAWTVAPSKSCVLLFKFCAVRAKEQFKSESSNQHTRQRSMLPPLDCGYPTARQDLHSDLRSCTSGLTSDIVKCKEQDSGRQRKQRGCDERESPRRREDAGFKKRHKTTARKGASSLRRAHYVVKQ